MSNEQNKIDIELLDDIIQSELDDYEMLSNYNRKDLLLKIVKENEKNKSKREPLQSLFNIISSKLVYGSSQKICDFLDLLLVKNIDFIKKYLEWNKKLAKINKKISEMENILVFGVPMKIHDGIIICSAAHDTEYKVIRDFGGSKWKRINHFLKGTKLGNGDVGKRGGNSYISLVTENLPDHRHELKNKDNTAGDIWKYNEYSSTDPDKKYHNTEEPGITWGEKNVYLEIGQLNWSTDEINDKPSSSRYVRPHLNIPNYIDVFFWECVDCAPVKEDDTDTIFAMAPAILKEEFEMEQKPLGAAPDGSISFNSISINDEIPEIKFSPGNDYLKELVGYDSLSILISDDLISVPEKDRFESKKGTIGELSEIGSAVIFHDKLEIEKRYLLKRTYDYLISDIQDRIYLALKRLAKLNNDTDIDKIKFKAVRGQYLFIYNKDSNSIVTPQDNYISNGISFIPVNNVFLRGTPLHTSNTIHEYRKYVPTGNELHLATSGGEDTVNINGTHFPKHLHWSSVVSPMKSVAVRKNKNDKGGNGSNIFKNAPPTGGIKYNFNSGTGPYSVETNDFGSKDEIAHNNIPEYGTLAVYLVV